MNHSFIFLGLKKIMQCNIEKQRQMIFGRGLEEVAHI